jgi:hypothetical protein
MNLAEADPLIPLPQACLGDREQRLSDALRDGERARLEFEVRLAAALAAEESERIERERADTLGGEVADIVRKFADEVAEIAARKSERVTPPSRRPCEPVRRSKEGLWWPFRRAG